MQEMPLFEGNEPIGVRNRVAGEVDGVQRAVSLDEEVILIVRATTEVGFKRDNHGHLWRNQTFKTTEAFEVPPDIASTILDASQRALDDAAGRQRIPFDTSVTFDQKVREHLQDRVDRAMGGEG